MGSQFSPQRIIDGDGDLLFLAHGEAAAVRPVLPA
jgi:hypothetical protein